MAELKYIKETCGNCENYSLVFKRVIHPVVGRWDLVSPGYGCTCTGEELPRDTMACLHYKDNKYSSVRR